MVTRRFYQRGVAIASWLVETHDDAPEGYAEFEREDGYGLEPRARGFTPLRALFLLGAVVFVAFWFWALFLIDKTAVNKIEDRAWAERAEAVCAPVKRSVRLLDLEVTTDLGGRADLVIESTDMLSAMLKENEAVDPTDSKGQAIVPDWIADYRTLLADRYEYAGQLRRGEDGPFYETPVQGVPITERIETFAGDNEMPSCAPPRAGVL